MKRTLLAALLVLSIGTPAQAHFQMLYTPQMAMEKGGTLDLKLVFTHPFEAGHTMNMGAPQEFFMVHKGEKTDLKDTLKKITWTSLTNSGDAYEAKVKARSMGDYVLCLVPEPYFEANEDGYIQQITKVILNNGGMPTDWDAPVGLPAEIEPLDKPYALWTGNVFRGVVLSEGKPVPGAEIEVEFLNHPPVPGKNEFQKAALATAPQDAFVTLTIKADADGEFVFGIPKAGWWGFAALGVGPLKTYKGKDNSQDAVIWVQAVDMQ
ncbi:MAG: DUF4198 domain-containing protein [Desulfovibrionaceae bacterium]|nr:DUF4198 domain-containing protein [Desulfovibrionaceae bacterium]